MNKQLTSTPWGAPQMQRNIAEGIIEVSTAGHGGYWLSPERMLEMRPEYRACSFSGNNWFEEDCSWCAVAMQWPQYFSEKANGYARDLFNNLYAQKKGA